MRFTRVLSLSLLAFAIAASHVSAQVLLFSSELESDAGWTIVADEDTSYEFGFDYSTLGIPKNPNNPSDTTTGLRLAANIEEPGAANRISVTPNDSFSGSYRLEADFWLNFHTSGGTTEYIGGFVGYDPAGLPINGIGLLGDSDGDSSADYRIYDRPSDQAHATALNNAEEAISMAFPGGTTPEAQSDASLFDPPNISVTAQDGTLGFGWHTLAIDVDATTGLVDLSIDDFSFGAVDASDDLASLEGSVALSFADLFSSVSGKPVFSFGVFDNVSVTQVPEPNGLSLAAVGLMALASVRRRR